MNFFGHYTQQYVNRRSKRARKANRILLWIYHYRLSYIRWLSSIRKLNLPPISGDDPVPPIVNYSFTYKDGRRMVPLAEQPQSMVGDKPTI